VKELLEVNQIKALSRLGPTEFVEFQELGRVDVKNNSYPIYSFIIGSKAPDAPCLGLFGGVHGLERVGTHVVMAYLEALLKRMNWDKDLVEKMKSSRVVSIPLINPGGMAWKKRANPNGVDLMRNAPVEGQDQSKFFIFSGHRISNKLPWYRGQQNKAMEYEAQILVDFVTREMFSSKISMAIDFHSGFGMVDRFWYPYAKTTATFPRIREVQAIKSLLDQSLPHHIYNIGPQSHHYTTHGDLWDYLFDDHHIQNGATDKIFLPWTLEMGSWNWVKKNPKQLFNLLGPFNPIIGHRYDRTMRRHISLIDFIFAATRNSHCWSK